jgi:hypothetical protein
MAPDDVQAVLDHRLGDIEKYKQLFREIEQDWESDLPQGSRFVLGFGKAVASAMETYITEHRHLLAEDDAVKTAVGQA